MTTPNDNQKSVFSRIEIIQAVRTPLGFFTLVVLVVEAILGITAKFSEGADRTYLIIGMLSLIFLLVIIVAIIAVFRPEALTGKRPKAGVQENKTNDIASLISKVGATQTATILVTAAIKFPDGISQDKLGDLRWDQNRCTYKVTNKVGTVKSQGTIAVVLGNNGWECRIPGLEDSDDSVELKLVEVDGREWEVPRFYPLTRNVIARELVLQKISVVGTIFANTISQGIGGLSIIAEKHSVSQEKDRVSHQEMLKSPPAIEEVNFNNQARLARSGVTNDYYDWTIFVNENDNILQQIDSVDYQLHPSFAPNDKQQRNNPKYNFACNGQGWGEFIIYIVVHLKTGVDLKTHYQLDFSKRWITDFPDK